MHGRAALSFFRYERLVLGLGGINRAGTGAGAAIDAGIGIDDELAVTLGNSLNGAVAGASATGDAIIGDNICHDNSLLSNDGYVSILSHFCKNAMGGCAKFTLFSPCFHGKICSVCQFNYRLLDSFPSVC